MPAAGSLSARRGVRGLDRAGDLGEVAWAGGHGDRETPGKPISPASARASASSGSGRIEYVAIAGTPAG